MTRTKKTGGAAANATTGLTAVRGVFLLDGDNPETRLSDRATQLRALTQMLFGQEEEAGLRALSEDAQDSVLWLVSDLAREVEELVYMTGRNRGAPATGSEP